MPRNLSAAPERKSGCGMVSFQDNKLVVITGWTGEKRTDELHVFNLEEGELTGFSLRSVLASMGHSGSCACVLTRSLLCALSVSLLSTCPDPNNNSMARHPLIRHTYCLR